MNKQGGILEHILSFWVYILIALVITIYIFLITGAGLSPVGNKLTFEKLATNADIDLINFLRTPTEFDLDKDGVKENTTLAQLIIYYKQDSKIITKEQIKEKIKSFLEPYYGPHCYSFWFPDVYVGEEPKYILGGIAAESEVKIPSLKGEIIETRLRIGGYYLDPGQREKCYKK